MNVVTFRKTRLLFAIFVVCVIVSMAALHVYFVNIDDDRLLNSPHSAPRHLPEMTSRRRRARTVSQTSARPEPRRPVARKLPVNSDDDTVMAERLSAEKDRLETRLREVRQLIAALSRDNYRSRDVNGSRGHDQLAQSSNVGPPPASTALHSTEYRGQRSAPPDHFLPNASVDKLKRSSALVDDALGSEFGDEPVVFSRFTLSRVFSVDRSSTVGGSGGHVVAKLAGYTRRDILEVVKNALNRLNSLVAASHAETSTRASPQNESRHQYTEADFIEGLCRTLPGLRTEYELYFRHGSATSSRYHKVVVVRPMTSLALDSVQSIEAGLEPIHILVPVSSSRLSKLQSFLDRYLRVCISSAQRVHLTVAYSGLRGLREARGLVSRFAAQYILADRVNLIAVDVENSRRNTSIDLTGDAFDNIDDSFSRGRTLHVAVNALGSPKAPDVSAGSSRRGLDDGGDGVVPDNEDALMFFCDVDVIFSGDFLERCRQNTAKRRRVYYPIVFSLYNPKYGDGTTSGDRWIVNGTSSNISNNNRPANTTVIISNETGFWRVFGYGMTCQYRSDYLAVGGFDQRLTGWGLEDVGLYRRHVTGRRVTVIRAPDPGLVHPWHAKSCDSRQLTSVQYRDCVRSRAVGEASHLQLGIRLLQQHDDVIDYHRTATLDTPDRTLKETGNT